MLLEESGEITPERMKRWSQSEDDSQLRDVIGDGSKVRCFKEQYCIGTWNVRSMNQGKLQVVKQEMARININILGISELKRTRMGKFNSDDHYIYYCGQESLRRNGVALIVDKRVRNAVQLGSIQLLSRVQLFKIPWTSAYQAPPSMGFSRQEYWNGGAIAFSVFSHLSHPKLGIVFALAQLFHSFWSYYSTLLM